MTVMNISLPDNWTALIDEQVEQRGYGTTSDYVQDLIRRDLETERMRALIQEGLDSPLEGPVDEAYFDDLRRRIREYAAK